MLSEASYLLVMQIFINNLLGPNAQNAINVQYESTNMRFFSSVLHLRGDHVATQPHERDGNVLCWNGEVCSILLPQKI